jgi:cellobiose dehydrogenase (acceptor)
MTDALLLVAFVDSNTVKHTLRYTTEYSLPAAYTWNATVLPIHSDVSEDSFTTIVHCKDCLHWEQDGSSGRASTSSGQMDLAYALSSEKPGGAAGCADEARFVRHSQQGTWVTFLDKGAIAESYRDWVGLAREGNNGC